MEFIGQNDPALGEEPPARYAVACRRRPNGKTRLLGTWTHTLTIGEPLPTLPLWIAENFAVPPELELSDEEMCRVLRIPKTRSDECGTPERRGKTRLPGSAR